jgi:26S proteasome regulatory subunit, ATPase 3, interacting protein
MSIFVDGVVAGSTQLCLQMNRPFGAVDVAANLKGAVPKTATQKILVGWSEKGELVQKAYGALGLSICVGMADYDRPGKTTFFVANQDKILTLPTEKLAALEKELNAFEERSKDLHLEIKTSSNGGSPAVAQREIF